MENNNGVVNNTLEGEKTRTERRKGVRLQTHISSLVIGLFGSVITSNFLFPVINSIRTNVGSSAYNLQPVWGIVYPKGILVAVIAAFVILIYDIFIERKIVDTIESDYIEVSIIYGIQFLLTGFYIIASYYSYFQTVTGYSWLFGALFAFSCFVTLFGLKRLVKKMKVKRFINYRTNQPVRILMWSTLVVGALLLISLQVSIGFLLNAIENKITADDEYSIIITEYTVSEGGPASYSKDLPDWLESSLNGYKDKDPSLRFKVDTIPIEGYRLGEGDMEMLGAMYRANMIITGRVFTNIGGEINTVKHRISIVKPYKTLIAQDILLEGFTAGIMNHEEMNIIQKETEELYELIILILSLIHLYSGDYNQSINLLETLDCESPWVLSYLGVAKMRQYFDSDNPSPDSLKDSETLFEKALVIWPDHPVIINNLALIELEMGEAENAYRVLSNVDWATTDPEYEPLWNTALITAVKTKRFENFATFFESKVKKTKDDNLKWALNCNLGIAYLNDDEGVRDLEKAEQFLSVAIAGKPASAIPHYTYGQVLLEKGTREKGERELEEAYKLSGKFRKRMVVKITKSVDPDKYADIDLDDPIELAKFTAKDDIRKLISPNFVSQPAETPESDNKLVVAAPPPLTGPEYTKGVVELYTSVVTGKSRSTEEVETALRAIKPKIERLYRRRLAESDSINRASPCDVWVNFVIGPAGTVDEVGITYSTDINDSILETEIMGVIKGLKLRESSEAVEVGHKFTFDPTR